MTLNEKLISLILLCLLFLFTLGGNFIAGIVIDTAIVLITCVIYLGSRDLDD